MELLFWIFFFFVMFFLILGIIVPIYKNHRKVTCAIINHDSTMSKFVYKIYLSKKEIINLLKTKNPVDELSCTFDFEKSVIRLSEYGSHRDYYFEIDEFSDFSILRLEQVSLFCMQSFVPYKLNPFIVNKLQAEIVSFSQYGF